mgnify:CR=1 FL=1
MDSAKCLIIRFIYSFPMGLVRTCLVWLYIDVERSIRKTLSLWVMACELLLWRVLSSTLAELSDTEELYQR